MSADRPPNILFVFSDQHRAADLGCYGNAEVRSPRLDRFAAEGLRFENAISNAPLCVPARGGLLTGRYPLRHGAWTNDLPVRPEVPSVAKALGTNGYRTGYFGKWHLGGIPRDQPIEKERRLGFEAWKACNCDHAYLNSYYDDEENHRHPIEGYDAATYTGFAEEFIRRGAENDRPWAAWLSWGPPHDPYFEVPEEWLRLYADRRLPLRPNVPGSIVDRLDLDRHWDRATVEGNLHGYYAHVSALDALFGRLLDALDATGQAENTLVVYTSDHGDQLGSHGWTNKQLPYEESIRVPLLVRGPNVAKGVSEALIGLTDLPVSLLAHAGTVLPGPDGEDLSALFADAAARGPGNRYIFDLVPCHQSAWRGTGAWRGVRTPTHTYACHDDGTPWLLFDNRNDPYQRQNLVHSNDHAELRAELHAATAAHAARHDALIPWRDLLRREGRVDDWNRSQRAFGEPELEP